jgi:hypothetical protein
MLARRHKPRLSGLRAFSRNLPGNLEKVRLALVEKTFTTSAYSSKVLHEPKERTIYILPFAPDRIVHHALMNVLIPIFEGLFITDTYACIQGRGIHAGSRRTMEFVRRDAYCLKCDISKFYPSMDHDIMMDMLRRRIKCRDTLWLLEDIVRSYPGGKNIPIGNFTSQWLGNLYLHEVDMLVKHELRIRDYIRYCDDFLLFHNDKAVLRAAARRIEECCAERLRLRLSKCDLFPTSRGVDFLGYRHFRDHILLRKSTAKRIKRRLRALPGLLDRGFIEPENARSVVGSIYGWLRWANTQNFQKTLKLKELTEMVNERCAEAATV